MPRPRNEQPPRKSIEIDEILLVAGLVLLVVGLWPWIGAAACVVPGAVLVWLSLPAREAFIARPLEEPRKESRS